MSWPELPLELCCNCGRSTDDWYLGDGRVVCGTRWDPFGTGVARSENKVRTP